MVVKMAAQRAGNLAEQWVCCWADWMVARSVGSSALLTAAMMVRNLADLRAAY